MSELDDAMARLEQALARLEAASSGKAGGAGADVQAVAEVAAGVAARLDAALAKLGAILEGEA